MQLNQCIETKGFRPVQAHNIHITLVFLGSIDTASELSIKHSVTGISAQPFALTFDRLSYWSKPKILCLTCSQSNNSALKAVT